MVLKAIVAKLAQVVPLAQSYLKPVVQEALEVVYQVDQVV